ncbi:hypothetical protein IFM89_028554, partial [Coptis chinensis]
QSREEPLRSTSSFVDGSEIYGRIDDIYSIESMLLSETDHQDSHVPLISIVGTGGFGKTTLVQLIVEDKEVKKNFETRMWVCVSQPFNLERVAKSIIEEATGYEVDTSARLKLFICQMTCLRVLDLSKTYLEELLDKTLKLNWCGSLKKLPKGIGKLRNLRHLELERTYKLSYFPRGLERLSCLRTLSKVVLDCDGGKGCQIGELKLLDHIQGELRIEGLGQVADSIEAVLKKKEKLRSLDLVFSEESDEERHDDEEERKRKENVLDGLQPHTNLAELRIEDYEGNRFPSWMMSSINSALPNLVKLKLRNCNQCSELPALGRLQNLEHLELWGWAQ